MLQRIQSLVNLLRKPLLFGLCGGLGCFIAALCFGEVFLNFTKLPLSPVKTGQTDQAIVLLIDTSGSMGEIIEGNPQPTGQTIVEDGKTYNIVVGGKSKLDFVKESLKTFIRSPRLTASDQIGIITFNTNASVVQGLTSAKNTSVLDNAINQLVNPTGSTDIQLALEKAILNLGDINTKRGILLFTDGIADNPQAALTAATAARKKGITIIAVATNEADTNFLKQVTDDPNLVFSTNSSQIDKSFQRAEQVIYGRQLVESGETADYGIVYGLLRISGWTGLLAIGVSLALISGQNLYMHRRVLSLKEFALGTLAGLLAGVIAGAIGQLVFLPIATLPIGEILGRVTGWGMLGTCLGGSMSFFMPNLKLKRALLGGLLGGVIGSLAFVLFASILGDVTGRLIGAAILGFFIGIMIALLEVLSQQPQLIVYWSTAEQSKIAIGKTPIVIGSSSEAHVHLSRGKGFPPVVAKIRQTEGRIVIEYSEAMRDQGMKVLVFELKHGEKRKFGDIMLEIKLKDNY